MSIIFVLIIISLLIAVAFLGAFFWAVKSGQYEDGYTPSIRILLDDRPELRDGSIGMTNQNSNQS